MGIELLNKIPKEIRKYSISFAFTMAEAVLVITILGILATIMITTLKPAEYKDKALKILADKVLGEIDKATTQIMLNDSRDGTMHNLIAVDGTYFGRGNTVQSNAPKIGALYKKYLATTSKECKDENCTCWKMISSSYKDNYNYFYLKDGACMAVDLRINENSSFSGYVFPGEDWDAVKDLKPKNRIGNIFFDINGAAEPNQMGKDQFQIPLGKKGIIYKQGSSDATSGNEGNEEEALVDDEV